MAPLLATNAWQRRAHSTVTRRLCRRLEGTSKDEEKKRTDSRSFSGNSVPLEKTSTKNSFACNCMRHHMMKPQQYCSAVGSLFLSDATPCARHDTALTKAVHRQSVDLRSTDREYRQLFRRDQRDRGGRRMSKCLERIEPCSCGLSHSTILISVKRLDGSRRAKSVGLLDVETIANPVCRSDGNELPQEGPWQGIAGASEGIVECPIEPCSKTVPFNGTK